jgi:hypothetical protein
MEAIMPKIIPSQSITSCKVCPHYSEDDESSVCVKTVAGVRHAYIFSNTEDGKVIAAFKRGVEWFPEWCPLEETTT